MTQLEPLVTPLDVEEALLRPLTLNECKYVPGLAVKVSSMLRTRSPGIDDRIAAYRAGKRKAPAVSPQTVAGVLAGALKRYMVNPEGAASISSTTGPLSDTVSFASYGKTIADGMAGQLAITDDDLKAINGSETSTPGSIRLIPALAPHRYGGRL